MSRSNSISRWVNFGPQLQSVLRIVAAFMFMQSGTMKLFAWPMGMPPNGSTAEFGTQIWIGGVLEAFGGLMLLIGWLTRPVAFILAGEMAVAYFQFHQPKGFWPVENGGVSAVVYCFLWLYYSAAGAGPWSVDAWKSK
ncbi:MAG: DoxX family protein [bacterium]|nr:DoxX family protein [bacterium]